MHGRASGSADLVDTGLLGHRQEAMSLAGILTLAAVVSGFAFGLALAGVGTVALDRNCPGVRYLGGRTAPFGRASGYKQSGCCRGKCYAAELGSLVHVGSPSEGTVRQ